MTNSEATTSHKDGAPAADSLTLDDYGRAIRLAFPSLAGTDPVAFLEGGWDSVVVETAGALVFRFPRHQDAALSQLKEARLLPFLRGYLTPAIPVPVHQASATPDFPWGFSGYEKIPGQALRPQALVRERRMQRLARDIGRFLHELHRFPAERARAFELPGPREWRAQHESLRDRVLPVLRQELGLNDYHRVRRWWRDFLANERAWDYQPALVHADLNAEHLIVDDEARALVGVIDWGDAAVADPAIDFVGLLQAYGGDFTWRVVDAYGAAGASVEPGLLQRVRLLAAAEPFHAVANAAAHGAKGGGAGPDLATAVAALREGSILSAPA